MVFLRHNRRLFIEARPAFGAYTVLMICGPATVMAVLI